MQYITTSHGFRNSLCCSRMANAEAVALTVALSNWQETCVQHLPSEHTAEIIEFSGAVPIASASACLTMKRFAKTRQPTRLLLSAGCQRCNGGDRVRIPSFRHTDPKPGTIILGVDSSPCGFRLSSLDITRCAQNLTPFCVETTGVTQKNVNSGVTWPKVEPLPPYGARHR